MSDPERLLTRAGSLDARLLSAALDERPPPDLLARTLATVGAAAPAAAAGAGAATVKIAAAKAAGGGILGAIGIGALAGALTVGAFEVASSHREGRASVPVESRREPAARVVPVAPPTPPAPPSPSAAEAPPQPVASPPAPVASSPRFAKLAVELALLDEARAALRDGDRARALAVLDRYARETPRGQMAREAALLRAEATREGERTNP